MIKYPPNAIKKCDEELKILMQLVIQSKMGGTTVNGSKGPERRLNSISGNLLNNINPVVKVINDKLIIDLEVVEYYQWLDTGSSKIKNPWFLTDEFINNIKVVESIERLTKAGIEFTIQEMLNVKIKVTI
jgi:hypothetical protein